MTKEFQGFRRMLGEPTTEKHPYSIPYNTIDDYKIFKITTNELLYVIYNHADKKYYWLERIDGDISNIDRDLKIWIKVLFK